MKTIKIQLPNGERQTLQAEKVIWNQDGTVLYLVPQTHEGGLVGLIDSGFVSVSLLAVSTVEINPA